MVSQRELEQAARDRQNIAKSVKARRNALRDIGPTEEIVNLDRRESCRLDFAKFCRTYNPEAFYLPWSRIHLQAIERIEECVLHGAMYAYAMPRGSGKTTLAKMAATWAISYSHRKYVFLIGATAGKGEDMLQSIKMWMRFGSPYIFDFPEIYQGVSELNGRGNSASAQTQNGESTMISWAKDSIVLPTVAPPPNFPFREYGFDSMPEFSPTSAAKIGTSGLTGEGLRGSVTTTKDGREVRPDFCIPDDPQTDASAKSVQQNQDRYDLMTGAVLGMAGPDKRISLLMPCTKIRNGDMVSCILDRKRNALFRGQTTAILTAMPKNMDLWEQYFEKYEWCAQQEPPDYSLSNQFYLDNQAEMDAGCEATWPERFFDNEISGIQHAMNLYVRDPKTFFAEYMNEPKEQSNEIVFLGAAEITQKQSNYPRFVVPIDVQTVTAFIDVQKELLFYGLVGWTMNFGGYILDYGTFPKQTRSMFEKKSLPKMLTKLYPQMTEDGRIYAALMEFQQTLVDLRLERDGDRKIVAIDWIGVDSQYKPTTVKKFIRDLRNPRVMPCFGGKWTGTEKPMNHPDYTRKWTTGGRRLGPNWRLGDASSGVQRIEINPNSWKTFVHERLATPLGEPGAISLWKTDPFNHQLFANHMCSEYRDVVETRWGRFDVWKLKPGAGDNDFLDVMAGNAVMASFAGISTTGVDSEEKNSVHRRVVDPKKWGKRR